MAKNVAYIDHERLFDRLHLQGSLAQFRLSGQDDDFFMLDMQTGVVSLSNALKSFLENEGITTIYEVSREKGYLVDNSNQSILLPQELSASSNETTFRRRRREGMKPVVLATEGEEKQSEQASDTQTQTRHDDEGGNRLALKTEARIIKSLTEKLQKDKGRKAVIFMYPDTMILEDMRDNDALAIMRQISEWAMIPGCLSYLICKQERFDDFRHELMRIASNSSNSVDLVIPPPKQEVYEACIKRMLITHPMVALRRPCEEGLKLLASRAISRGENLRQFCHSLARQISKNGEDAFYFLEDAYQEDNTVVAKRDQAIAELNALIAMTEAKQQLQRLIRLCKDFPQRLPHTLITGNPGSGKTTLAAIMGKLFLQLGRKTGKVVELKYGNIAAGINHGEIIENMNKEVANAGEGIIVIDNVNDFLVDDWSSQALKTLIDEMSGTRDLPVIMTLPNNPSDVAALENFANLASHINLRISLHDFSAEEQWEILEKYFTEKKFIYKHKVKEKVIHYFEEQKRRGMCENGHGSMRMLQEVCKKVNERCGEDQGACINEEDIPEPPHFDGLQVKELLRQLGKEKAWKQPKRFFEDLANRQEFKSRQEQHKADEPRNFLFLGNPGTGKTTFAKKYAAPLLCSMGMVSTAELKECDPIKDFSTADGRNYSQRVRAIFKEAKHKVLFIDEAYQLATGANGKDVLDQIVKLLTESEFSDLIVIMAGYPDEMTQLYKLNPGFKRRFPNEVYFEDFSLDELVEIFEAQLKSNNFFVQGENGGEYDSLDSPEVAFFRENLKKNLEVMAGQRHFGNAGSVNNYFEQVQGNYLARIKQDSTQSFLENDKNVLLACDLHTNSEEQTERLSDILADLRQNMVGCSDLTDFLENMEIKQKFTLHRATVNHSVTAFKENYNFVFIGESGTGKKTAANYLARMLYSMRLLPHKKPRIVPAVQLTGQYTGQTKIQVQELFEKSTGGVLVLTDWAPLLDTSKSGFAGEAISTFLAEVTSKMNTLSMSCVIADTEANWNKLIQLYPTIAVNFPNVIHFQSLKTTEATQLVLALLIKAKYELPENKEVIQSHLNRFFEKAQNGSHLDGNWIERAISEVERNICCRLGKNIPDDKTINQLQESDFSF